MEKKQTPNKKVPTSDRHPQSSFDVLEEPERPGEEGFPKADEAEELPFDVPRD